MCVSFVAMLALILQTAQGSGALDSKARLELPVVETASQGAYLSEQEQTAITLQVGETTESALKALRQMGVKQVELSAERPRRQITRIDDLPQLAIFQETQLVFDGVIAGRFTFSDSRIEDRWLNPRFTSDFSSLADCETVAQLIESAAERMRSLRGITFIEVTMPIVVYLPDITDSDIQRAARSPTWRVGGEGNYGEWGYTIQVRNGKVESIQVEGTPPN